MKATLDALDERLRGWLALPCGKAARIVCAALTAFGFALVMATRTLALGHPMATAAALCVPLAAMLVFAMRLVKEQEQGVPGALLLGVPIALLTAIYLAFFCPKGLYRVFKPAVELLAGIPSVVYGFFGMVVIVPCIRTVAALFDVDISGSSILAASVLLGIMILPTVIGVSEAALRAVPSAYYEGAVAMGARHERAIFTVMLPAAKSGVLAGVVLGIGRAIGETMAVIMVAGNQPRLTGNMLKGIRTMTANIVIEMGYATGLHREALIATGVVLFVFILIINLTFSILKRRKQA